MDLRPGRLCTPKAKAGVLDSFHFQNGMMHLSNMFVHSSTAHVEAHLSPASISIQYGVLSLSFGDDD